MKLPAQIVARVYTLPKDRIIAQFAFLMVVTRTFGLILVQGTVASIFQRMGDSQPFISAASWWTVYGTVVDIICLLLLSVMMRGEGRTIFSLLDFDRSKIIQDIKNGLIVFVLIFPLLGFLFPMGVMSVLFDADTHSAISGQLTDRSLPFWAYLYSLTIWWIIWSATEEITYQGYCLPRLLRRFGQTRTLILIGVFWALQHSFLPLIMDWRYMLWRFISFLPLVFAMIMAYVKLGRLAPIILAHALMDVAASYGTFHQ